jgi:hypothetical protein
MSERSQAACKVTKLRLAAGQEALGIEASWNAPVLRACQAEPIMHARPLACARSVKRHAAALPWAGRSVVAHIFRAYWRGTWLPQGGSASALEGERRSATAGGARAARAHDHADDHHDGQRQQSNIRNWPTPRPGPANWPARPGPGPRPATQHGTPGRLGAAAAGAAAGVAGLAAAALFVAAPPCEGAVRRSRWVTLLDCCPTDCRHPCAWPLRRHMDHRQRQRDQNHRPRFIMSSPLCHSSAIERNHCSALDSNMQGHHSAGQVVIVHMPKAICFMRALSSSWPGCIRMDSAR